MSVFMLTGAAFALSGCVTLEEQRTARFVICNGAAPVALVGGQRVEGLDLIRAVQEKEPDRIIIMAESGVLGLMARPIIEAFKAAGQSERGLTFADGAADQAQAKRLCAGAR
jgi:type II secretory pathway component PulC